jgi:hypothetical protein
MVVFFFILGFSAGISKPVMLEIERLKFVKDHDVVVVGVRLRFHNEVIIGLFNHHWSFLAGGKWCLGLLARLVDKNSFGLGTSQSF